jgi:hypothetical protein
MTGDLFTACHVDVHAPGAAQGLTARLARDGLATFTGITDPAALFTLANSVCEVVLHRDSDPEGVTTITDTAGDATPKPGYRAFSSLALFPHTDGTAQPHPPALLWLACTQPAEQGGASILVDGAEVWQTLTRHYPVTLAALSTPGLVSFGEDPAYTASVFEPAAAQGRLRIRFRNDELVHPIGVAEAVWPILLEVVAANRHELPLAAGQGYVLANSHWLHGRAAYTGGRRRMLRLLGTPTARPWPSVVIPDGFPTTTTHATTAASR